MSRRRLRKRLPIIFAVTATIGAVVVYTLWPVLQQHWRPGHRHLADSIATRGVEVFVVAWFAWVGASIGSFLNVVAWRMPRGDGINGRSICPRCRTQLKAIDNFPVFGWLALGGRCRTCHLPISKRYPIVETAVSASIAIVATAEFFQRILPYEHADWLRPKLRDFGFDTAVIATLTYHVVAMSASWAMGLIRMDGNRLPAKLVAFATVGGVLPMLAYPTLMVVPWQMNVPDSWRPDRDHLGAVLRVITALVAAIFLARSLARSLCPTADPKADPLGKGTERLIDLITILAIPILVVGWQASVAVVVLASVVATIFRSWLPSADALGRLAISMPVALTIQITIWRWSHPFAYWPSEGVAPWVILAWAAVAMLIPNWLHDDRRTEKGVRPQ